jgi:hypothetical protein
MYGRVTRSPAARKGGRFPERAQRPPIALCALWPNRANDAAIPIAEAAAVGFNGGRWYRWIAETRMTAQVRRQSRLQIVPCRSHAVVKTLILNLRQRGRRWRRRIIGDRLWMRTPGQYRDQENRCCGNTIPHCLLPLQTHLFERNPGRAGLQNHSGTNLLVLSLFSADAPADYQARRYLLDD